MAVKSFVRSKNVLLVYRPEMFAYSLSGFVIELILRNLIDAHERKNIDHRLVKIIVNEKKRKRARTRERRKRE